MNLLLSQSVLSLSPTLPERFVAATAEAARAAVNAFQASWRDQACDADQAHAYERMAEIDEHTLRDIGAPNWLIAQAVERKSSHHMHLIELHRS